MTNQQHDLESTGGVHNLPPSDPRTPLLPQQGGEEGVQTGLDQSGHKALAVSKAVVSLMLGLTALVLSGFLVYNLIRYIVLPNQADFAFLVFFTLLYYCPLLCLCVVYTTVSYRNLMLFLAFTVYITLLWLFYFKVLPAIPSASSFMFQVSFWSLAVGTIFAVSNTVVQLIFYLK